MRKAYYLLIILLLAAAATSAQDIQIITDEEALFGSADELPAEEAAPPAGGNAGDSLFSASEDELFQDDGVEKVPSGAEGAAVAAFLKTDAVRIGGSFSGTVDSEWTWTDPWTGNGHPLDPDDASLPISLSALVFFDARPAEDYRVYGSAKTKWPFADSNYIPNIQVFELFSDFNWNDAVFFRFGKHTVKWGVGYFWSPADVLNIVSIDVEDPTAQREGPISLRAHFPVPGTQTNLWGYLLVPDIAVASALEPADLGAAGKLEFLVGGWELGFGAFYQRDNAPKGMLTATGALGRFNLFGEAVLGWGSDKEFVKQVSALIPNYIVTEKIADVPVFSGTAGFMWTEPDWDLTLTGQYFYNQDSYTDSERESLIADAHAAEPAIRALIGPAASENFLKGLIYGSGRHYAGLSISKTEFGVEDLSLSVLAIANLSDLSGMVAPSLSFELFERMTLKAGATFYWTTSQLWGAGDDGEYVVIAGGPAVTLGLGASLGGGRF